MARRAQAAKALEEPTLFDFLKDSDFENAAALLEAGRQYGGDAAQELADLQAGRHPLQQSEKRRA
jgi:hypothetical protein